MNYIKVSIIISISIYQIVTNQVNRGFLIMGKASTKAKNKYNATAYDQISIKPPKGTKSEWQAEAEKQGENLTEYITNAVKMRMEADRKREEDNLLADFYSQDIYVLCDDLKDFDFAQIYNFRSLCQIMYGYHLETIGEFKEWLTNKNAKTIVKQILGRDINDIGSSEREGILSFIKLYTIKRKIALEEARRKLDY